MKNFHAEPMTIKDLLSKKDVVFRVPPYQRPYSWESEQTLSFWEDLNDFDEINFLGTFVVNNEYKDREGFVDLIDGQQRIITITMMLAILRNQFYSNDLNSKAEGIHSSYICNRDDNGNDSYKLKVGNSLENYFINCVQKNNNSFDLKQKTEEQKLLERNYKILNDRLCEQLKKESDKELYLTKLRDRIKDFEIVFIEVDKEEDAFTFFETLNARGLELSTADVLKNLIFKKLNKQENINKLQESWQNITDNLTDNNEEIDASRFIRHYWLSKNKFITQKRLFRSIKGHMEGNSREYAGFLSDLERESFFYRKINFPIKEEWNGDYIQIYKSLKNLKKMKTSQSNSIMLSLMRVIHRKDYSDKYKTKYIRDTFLWIEYFTFTFSVIAKKSPAPLERMYSRYAILIDRAKNKKELENSLLDFKQELIKLTPDKDSFVDGFKNIRYSKANQKLIIYILEKINYAESNEQSFDNVNIEHIIPQNPDKKSKYKKDKIKDFVDNIGNLMPLGPEYNKEASNHDPINKIEYYKKSEIKMASDIIDKIGVSNDWGEFDVENRAIDLANMAWKIWNINN